MFCCLFVLSQSFLTCMRSRRELRTPCVCPAFTWSCRLTYLSKRKCRWCMLCWGSKACCTTKQLILRTQLWCSQPWSNEFSPSRHGTKSKACWMAQQLNLNTQLWCSQPSSNELSQQANSIETASLANFHRSAIGHSKQEQPALCHTSWPVCRLYDDWSARLILSKLWDICSRMSYLVLWPMGWYKCSASLACCPELANEVCYWNIMNSAMHIPHETLPGYLWIIKGNQAADVWICTFLQDVNSMPWVQFELLLQSTVTSELR